MNTINIRQYANNEANYPIWHPYSSNGTSYFDRINFIEGENIYLFDANGKKYIDLSSGLWNVSLGYGNKEIEEAMIEQIKKLSYCSLFEYTNATAIKGANKLLNLLSGDMKKVIYGCSGSESIEVAIKIMRSFWANLGKNEKKTILSFSNSYHGTYFGSISVSGLEQGNINKFAPVLDRVEFINPKFKKDCKWNNELCNCQCLEEFNSMLEENKELIAGIIIEPILASKGVLKPCKRFLEGLVDQCKKQDILVAFDEVALGFYRTGKSFYYKKLNFEPDIICLSKGINSGYLPLSVTVVNNKINENFLAAECILEHGSTQGGNPIACAAMIATINQLEDIVLNEDLERKSESFYFDLKEKLKDIRLIKDIRQEGFLMAIEFTNEYGYFNIEDSIFIKNKLQENGLLVYTSDLGITLLPMIITTSSQWNQILIILERVLKEIDS